MGKHYKHLNSHGRYMIELMLAEGQKKSFIANYLGVHISTIYREIKRNRHYLPLLEVCRYYAWRAQNKYLSRRKQLKKLDAHKDLMSFVKEKLKRRWSPWQIEWQLKYHATHLPSITHQTLYSYIYSNFDFRFEVTKYLRRARRFQKNRDKKKQKKMNLHHIKLRTADINERISFGHWECDLMMFKKGEHTNLITLVERKTRKTIAIKNASKHSRTTAMAIVNAFKSMKQHVSSITFDQGSEFSHYDYIRRSLDADVYFCTPGSPYEKGSIENRNGVIRSVFPRNIDIESLTQKDIEHEIDSINERPMAILNYQSPQQAFSKMINIST